MKEYPSISKEIRTDINIYAFDKYDGSNIRGEWSKKRGFYKFGSKTRLLGEDDKILGESIVLVRAKYQESLGEIFLRKKWDQVTCFFEFFGPNSFAGNHDLTEKHDVVLFDVNLYKRGLLNPAEFIDLFGHLDIPQVLYYGKANSFLVEQIRTGTLSGMTFEGCVCKGRNVKKTHIPIMFKIKNQAWLDKLKSRCQEDEKLFQFLS